MSYCENANNSPIEPPTPRRGLDLVIFSCANNNSEIDAQKLFERPLSRRKPRGALKNRTFGNYCKLIGYKLNPFPTLYFSFYFSKYRM